MRKQHLGVLWLVGWVLTSCSTSTTTTARGGGGGGGGGDAGAGSSAGGEAGATTEGGSSGAATGGKSTAGGASTTGAQGGSSTAALDLSCSSYCALVQSNCSTDTTRQYKSDDSCMNSCAAFRLGSRLDASGNTLGCRAHFAALAGADPATNCPAAGPAGVGSCGTNCDSYCALMATICPSVYEDEAVCRAACVTMTGVASKTYQSGGSGDNLQCRIYHATFAAEGFPAVHCPHASSIPMAPCAN